MALVSGKPCAALYTFHIALISKAHGALQFVVFIILVFKHGFSWRRKLDCPEKTPVVKWGPLT